MEFRFSVHPIFHKPIVKINYNLLPQGFVGDRRTALDIATKVSEIINEVGEASAKAQGLSKPVTTAQKLRLSDQNIYLLGDKEQGKNGAVLGLLKVGKKSLYVFDKNGETLKVDAPCVLDFYVHESRQRSGLGKELFETMLHEEKFIPVKMAVDRPSDKLIGFLRKHYGLQNTIPQMNNFVVYEGFFDTNVTNLNNHDTRLHITSSPNTALFGPQFTNDDCKRRSKCLQQQNSSGGLSLMQNSPVGRYAAPRPMCSMAEYLTSPTIQEASIKRCEIKRQQNIGNSNDGMMMLSNRPQLATTSRIIHSTATPATGEPNRNHNDNHHVHEEENHGDADVEKEVEAINVKVQNLELTPMHQVINNENISDKNENIQKPDVKLALTPVHDIESEIFQPATTNFLDNKCDHQHITTKPTHFNYSKQHTGLKNISYNVGIAVSPTNKMEFNQERQECFKINRPIPKHPAGLPMPHDNNADAVSTVSSQGSGDGYTDQGYFDLKFYHNKLW